MITWVRRVRLLVFALLGIGLALLAYLLLTSPPPPPNTHTGTPDVSLRYTLTDAYGRTVSEHTFLGRPVVYLFGWTRDPDLTPAALQILGAALKTTRVRDAVPVFVTLDPSRDDAVALAEFVGRSTIPIIALVGTQDDVDRLAASARLYVRRIDDASAAGGYRIDHTVAYLVVDRHGRFAGVVPYDTSAKEVAVAIDALVR
jgi:protein SCO1/2